MTAVAPSPPVSSRVASPTFPCHRKRLPGCRWLQNVVEVESGPIRHGPFQTRLPKKRQKKRWDSTKCQVQGCFAWWYPQLFFFFSLFSLVLSVLLYASTGSILNPSHALLVVSFHYSPESSAVTTTKQQRAFLPSSANGRKQTCKAPDASTLGHGRWGHLPESRPLIWRKSATTTHHHVAAWILEYDTSRSRHLRCPYSYSAPQLSVAQEAYITSLCSADAPWLIVLVLDDCTCNAVLSQPRSLSKSGHLYLFAALSLLVLPFSSLPNPSA